MSSLMTFDFEDHVVRSVRIDGEPWFVGKDICACLGIENHRDAVSTLDEDEKGVEIFDTLGGDQEMLVINESGVYHLIFRSRKAAAQRFRRWVLHEVLPSIRKTGYYSTVSPDWDETAEKLRLVQEARRIFGRKAAQGLWEQFGLPLVIDESTQKNIQDKASLSNYLRDFIDQCLIADPKGRISADELYKLYSAWAAQNAAPYFTKNHFGKMLIQDIGMLRIKVSTSFYCGYRIDSNYRNNLVLGEKGEY